MHHSSAATACLLTRPVHHAAIPRLGLPALPLTARGHNGTGWGAEGVLCGGTGPSAWRLLPAAYPTQPSKQAGQAGTHTHVMSCMRSPLCVFTKSLAAGAAGARPRAAPTTSACSTRRRPLPSPQPLLSPLLPAAVKLSALHAAASWECLRVPAPCLAGWKGDTRLACACDNSSVIVAHELDARSIDTTGLLCW